MFLLGIRNDSATIRAQLASLQTTLRDCLTNLREQNLRHEELSREPAPDPAPLEPVPPTHVDVEPAGDVDDASSVSSATTASTTITVPHGPTGSQRFTKALIKGQVAGPLGETVQQRLQRLAAVKTARVAGVIASTPGVPIRALVAAVVTVETSGPGLHSPESAAALAALGKAYQDMEDYGSALEYYHEALVCREHALPAGDLVTLNTMENIATVFELARLWDDALAYWRQFYEGLRTNPRRGPNHPTTLSTRFRIARAKSMGGNDDEALTDLTELLSLYDGMANGGGAGRLQIRWERAKVQGRQGQYDDALEVLGVLLAEQEALATSRAQKFSPGDRRTLETVETAAGLRRDISALEEKRRAASLPAPALSTREGKRPVPPPKPSQPSLPTGNHTRSVGGGEASTAPSGSSDGPSPAPGPSAASGDPATASPTDEDTTDIGEIQAYHAELIRVRAEKGNLHPETLDLMFALANAYASHERYESAVNWFKEALAGRERNLGASNPLTAATEFHLAKTYTDMGDIPTALAHFERVLTHREAKLGPDHPDTLATVLAIGSIYSSGPYQNFAEAVRLVQRAVAGFLSRLGTAHSATLNAQFQMAEIHVGRGHEAQGIQLHEQVLALRRRHLGEHHHSTLASKYCLAAAYWKTGGPDNDGRDKAIALYEEAFRGREQLFSRKHSATSRAASQLAEAYWTMERWQDALECYAWVLEGIRHRQPNAPMAALIMLSNIAACHSMMGQHAESLEWLRKVLALHEAHTAPDDPARVAALENVAIMCMRAGKAVEALDLFARVVAAREKAGLADGDEDLASLLYHLSTCTFQADQRQACLVWTRRFLDVPEDAPGVTTEMRLVARRRVGLVHLHDKQADEAVAVYEPLLEQLRAAAPPALTADHWLRRCAADELAAAHRMRLVQTDAIADLHARRERLKRLLDTDRPVAIARLARLADVHLVEHEYSEAAALYDEVLDFVEEAEARRRLGLDPADDEDEGEDAGSDGAAARRAAAGPDLNEIRNAALSSLANAHMALANHERALALLARLADSESAARWRRGALIRKGDLQERMGEYVAALTTWMALLNEMQRVDDEGKRRRFDELRTMRKIASLHLLMCDAPEALRWGEQALEGFRNAAETPAAAVEESEGEGEGKGEGKGGSADKDTSPTVEALRTLDFIASVYFSLGRIREAITTQKEAAEGFEQALGHKAKATLAAALDLAEMYTGMEQRDEAIVWYNKALDGYEINVHEAHPRLQDGDARRVAVLGRRLGVATDAAV